MRRSTDIIERVNAGPISIEDAFRYCEELAHRHYENFPVASFFLPRSIRPAVAAIYAFARTADDIADEGTLSESERLAALDDWQRRLDQCGEGTTDHPIFLALGTVLAKHAVPRHLLSDLLTAFRMDVTIRRYATFDDLLTYCRHSANPVGRIVLHLFGDRTERSMDLSDNICTALQLTNFWQDVQLDARKGRIYLPLEDLSRFGYTEHELFAGITNDRFRELIRFQLHRTRELFKAGEALLSTTVPALRFELRLTWQGGMRILEKIERSGFDVFEARPVLRTADKAAILLKAILPTPRTGGR